MKTALARVLVGRSLLALARLLAAVGRAILGGVAVLLLLVLLAVGGCTAGTPADNAAVGVTLKWDKWAVEVSRDAARSADEQEH